MPASGASRNGGFYNAAVDLVGANIAAGRGSKLAYIDDTGEYTFDDLDLAVRRAANALTALGAAPEQRILICMLDSFRLPVTFLGAIRAGLVPVLANTLLTAADYRYMLDDSRAQYAIVSAPLAAAFAAAGGTTRVITDGGDDEELSALYGAASSDHEACATSVDDFCFWLYSSGSTGRPKGTVHVHSSLRATHELYAQPVLGLSAADCVFSAAKLFFAYGLGNALSFPLCAGATTVLMAERPTPAAVFQRLRQYQPTVFYGVPTLYAAMLADPMLPAADELRLRVCTSAGEALPRDIGERWQQHFGVDILDGIGSTEMLHIFLSNRQGECRYGTTGTPLPGYELRLLDDDGALINDNQMGELQVRGPTAAALYWNRRELSRHTFLGEWTRTGDKYRRDEDGYYIYCGRSDDMLKVGGIYVSPAEVESALVSHPAVLEAAVVGRADDDELVKPAAYVVLTGAAQPSAALAQELQDFVKNALAAYKYPRWLEFVDDLPKTATGKVQRFRLRQGSA